MTGSSDPVHPGPCRAVRPGPCQDWWRYDPNMSFKLAATDLDRVSDVPLYRQLANLFQEAIARGELAEDDPLPSEVEISATAGVSRTVIRDAMDELVRDGLIVKRPGAVPRVAARPERRRIDTDRYVSQEPAADGCTVKANYPREKATSTDAELLGIDVGAPVLHRTLVVYDDGQPLRLQGSIVPLSIARGTVLADPNAQPYPGGTAWELRAAGQMVTRVAEDVAARMPTGEERRLLQQVTAGPVLDVTRTFYVGDQVVEISRVITPAATTLLHYETYLSDD